MINKSISSPSSSSQPVATTLSSKFLFQWRTWLARWRAPLIIFGVWRAWLVVVSLWAGANLPVNIRYDEGLFIAPDPNFLINRLVNVMTHWDAEYFIKIAQVGYSPDSNAQAFFPLYPLIVRIVTILSGGHYLLAGLLVNLVFSLALFIVLYELVCSLFNSQVAIWSVICLAVYPTSFFLAACYSESTFLLFALSAFLVARKTSNWPLVGLMIGLATLSRNIGIFLLLPLGWEWLQQHWHVLEKDASWKERWQRLQPLPTAFLVGVPLVLLGSWFLFNGLYLGSPFGFLTITADWGRHSAMPWQTTGLIFDLIRQGQLSDWLSPVSWDIFCWIFAVSFWLASVYLARRKQFPVSYVIYLALTILVPMTAPADVDPLYSYSRYSIIGFPIFMLLALHSSGKYRYLIYLYAIVSFLFMTFFFARYSNWQWVA